MKSTQEFEKLEALIETLEDPNLDLDEAVDLYAKALKDAHKLLKSIKTIQQKITTLNEESQDSSSPSMEGEAKQSAAGGAEPASSKEQHQGSSSPSMEGEAKQSAAGGAEPASSKANKSSPLPPSIEGGMPTGCIPTP